MELRDDQMAVNDRIVGRFAGPIHLVNDKGILRFEDGEKPGETHFWIGDTPAGHIWPDGGSSSFHYFKLLGGDASLLPPDLEKWESWVQDRPPEDFSLEKLFSPFKPLLPSGEYWLVYAYPVMTSIDIYETGPDLFYLFPQSNTLLPEHEKDPPYFEFQCFFETRASGSLDLERIAFYQNAIEAGRSPVIVAYSRYKYPRNEDYEYHIPHEVMDQCNPYFILDGHHKARAYEALNIAARRSELSRRLKPGILHICKVERE